MKTIKLAQILSGKHKSEVTYDPAERRLTIRASFPSPNKIFDKKLEVTQVLALEKQFPEIFGRHIVHQYEAAVNGRA